MSSLYRLVLGFGLLAALAGPLRAENKNGPKTPADLAEEQFFKLRNDPEAKPGPARFQKMIAAGVGFIIQNPTHPRTPAVISGLATFGTTIKEKNLAAMRASWLPTLKVEVVNQRHSEKLSEEAHAAIVALEAAVAGVEARELYNRESVSTFREKIDALAELPAGSRFLLAQEKEYLEIVKLGAPKAAEAHALKLAEHPDQKIAAMARDELNIMDVKKQPFELKFTALDGREVDFAQLRGKVVVLVFWSASNEGSVNEQIAIREALTPYSKQVEVVGVACDKPEDREKVLKIIKDKKLTWAHHFDGNGHETDFVKKLNVRNVPTIVVFDPRGIYVGAGIRANRLEVEVKRLLAIK